MKQYIDLRSDTVTQPSKLMLDELIQAPLGDDVFSEDPTVNMLEEKAAKLLGKEKALLVPSGTMGNLIAVLVHCPRGTEVILGDCSHTFIYEAGGISAFGGIHSHQLQNENDGTIKISSIQNAIRQDNIHFPRTALICLENTHNMCSGSPISSQYMQDVLDLAKKNALKVHTDGARIFNAAIFQNIDVGDLVKDVDSITFCLSKGLSAPIGSVLCGTKQFIDEARRIRKALGGGMRQAGIIAASGSVALDQSIEQLVIDHDNAQYLAEEINKITYLDIEIDRIKTNILYFTINHELINGSELVNLMHDKGIKFFEVSKNKFRLVTHSGINHDNVKYVIKMFNEI